MNELNKNKIMEEVITLPGADEKGKDILGRSPP